MSIQRMLLRNNIKINLKRALFIIIWLTLTLALIYMPDYGEGYKNNKNFLDAIDTNILLDEIEGVKNYEKRIRLDEAKVVPGSGEFGTNVILEGDEYLAGVESYSLKAVNEFLSKKIALNRSLDDFRDMACIPIIYDKILPSASVVIIFYNEPLSTLLRTVWSVLNTSERFLLEVILVDDCSSSVELKGELNYYVNSRMRGWNVKIINLPERSGLVQARLTGASAARGDVLVFLDSHCECVEDWLRPLLQRIRDDSTVVAIPIVDTIDAETFLYNPTSDDMVGGFLFGSGFVWINIQQKDAALRKNNVSPIRSPTMSGGLFAIDREYFWEIGSYDENMKRWGGENLEMSFRIWMCGGSLEIIPCSRVGHLYKSFQPYDVVGAETLAENTARTAKVWMDEYAKYHYEARVSQVVVSDEDVASRKLLRKMLNCHSFKWYLQNVYPEKYIPGEFSVAYGRMMNAETGLCIDGPFLETVPGAALRVFDCFEELKNQQFLGLSLYGELRTEEMCTNVVLDTAKEVQEVIWDECHKDDENQRWTLFNSIQICHKLSDLCLDAEGLVSRDQLILRAARVGAKSQQWVIESEYNAKHDEPLTFDNLKNVDLKDSVLA